MKRNHNLITRRNGDGRVYCATGYEARSGWACCTGEGPLGHQPRLQGAALYRAGKYQQALNRFEQAAKKAPLLASDWYVLAMAHHQLGHAHEAAVSFQNGIRAERQTPFVALSWTVRLTEDRLRTETEELFKEAR